MEPHSITLAESLIKHDDNEIALPIDQNVNAHVSVAPNNEFRSTVITNNKNNEVFLSNFTTATVNSYANSKINSYEKNSELFNKKENESKLTINAIDKSLDDNLICNNDVLSNVVKIREVSNHDELFNEAEMKRTNIDSAHINVIEKQNLAVEERVNNRILQIENERNLDKPLNKIKVDVGWTNLNTDRLNNINKEKNIENNLNNSTEINIHQEVCRDLKPQVLNTSYVLDRKGNEASIINFSNQTVNPKYDVTNDKFNDSQLLKINKTDTLSNDYRKDLDAETVIKSSLSSPNNISNIFSHQKFKEYMYDNSTKSKTILDTEKKSDNEVSSSNIEGQYVFHQFKPDYSRKIVQKDSNPKRNEFENMQGNTGNYKYLSTISPNSTSTNIPSHHGLSFPKMEQSGSQQIRYYNQHTPYDNNMYSDRLPAIYEPTKVVEKPATVFDHGSHAKGISNEEKRKNLYSKWNSPETLYCQNKPDNYHASIENDRNINAFNDKKIEYLNDNIGNANVNSNLDGHYLKTNSVIKMKDTLMDYNRNQSGNDSYSLKSNSLSQLQMKPPDFSKIITPNEHGKSISKDIMITNKSNNHPFQVTPQNFKEISKKYNYISDLQLKQPSHYLPEYGKVIPKRNQMNQSYSNLYVKTPDFCAKNVKKIETNTEDQRTIDEISNDNLNYINIKKYPQLAQDVEMSVVVPKMPNSFGQNPCTSNEGYRNSKRGDIMSEKDCYNSSIAYGTNYSSIQQQNMYHKTKNATPLPDIQNFSNTYSPEIQISTNHMHQVNNNENRELGIPDMKAISNKNIDYNANDITGRFKYHDNKNPRKVNWYNAPKNNIVGKMKLNQQEMPQSFLNTRALPDMPNTTVMDNMQPLPNLPPSKYSSYYWSQQNEKKMSQNPTRNVCINSSPTLICQNSPHFLTPSPKSSPSPLSGHVHSSPSPQTSMGGFQNFKTYSPHPTTQSNYIVNVEKSESSGIQKIADVKNIRETDQIHVPDHQLLNTVRNGNNENSLRLCKKTGSSIRGISDINPNNKPHQKPNYREMINHVYALRNSTSEDDLNLEIIKRTLNCEISLRKFNNDLNANISKSPIPIKSNFITMSNGLSNAPKIEDNKRNVKKSYIEFENRKNINSIAGINNMPQTYAEHEKLSGTPIIPKNDISVTLSKISKSCSNSKVENLTPAVQSKIISSDIAGRKIIVNNESDFASKTQIRAAESTTKSYFTTPLDLSVKTIKTTADSTGCDDSINIIRPNKSNGRSSFKVDFCPNFSEATSAIKSHDNLTSRPFLNPCTSKLDKSVLPNIDQEEFLNSNSNSLPGNLSSRIVFCRQNENVISDERKLNTSFTKYGPSSSRTLVKLKPDQLPINNEPKIDLQSADQMHPTKIFLQQKSTNSLKIPNQIGLDFSLKNNHNPTYNCNYRIGSKCNESFNQVIKKEMAFSKERNEIKKTQLNHKQMNSSAYENTRCMQQNQKIYENQHVINYSNRKRTEEITKHLPEKKARLDEFNEDLSGVNKQLSPIVHKNLIESEMKNHASDINLLGFDSNLGYRRLPEQKSQNKVWYPPLYANDKNVHCMNKANILTPNQQTSVITQTTNGNATGLKKVDQNVISKLKNSIEMRDCEKRKQLINKDNYDHESADIAYLLAARIRTKGELKGFNAMPSLTKETMISPLVANSDIKSIESTEIQVESSLKDENGSSLNLLDWGSACNDFVEQLKFGVNQKRNKKINTFYDYKQEDNNVRYDIKMIPNQLKRCNGTSNSSDEDKPLYLLRQQSQGDESMTVSKNTDTKSKIDFANRRFLNKQFTTDASLLKIRSHSSVVEKISERIGRNIREKQRIEQEKRLAARLGKGSSSENEDNVRTQRPKKVSKKPRTRTNARELSDTDSSDSESSALKKRQEFKRKLKSNLGRRSSASGNENTAPLKTQFAEALLEKREIMTKAEMKFMSPSAKTGKDSNDSDSDKSKKSKIKTSISTHQKNATNNQETNFSKCKKISTVENKVSDTIKDETMTRSKKRKELEKQIANSKILRNDKIIKNTFINNKTKVIDNENSNIINRRALSLSKLYNLKKKTAANLKAKSDSSSRNKLYKRETILGRLRPKRTHENFMAKKSLQVKKHLKEDKFKNENKKLIQKSINRRKKTLETTNVEYEDKQKQNITMKFPPGWEHQVYEYKKSLKIPLSLITIKGPPCHRISTSLPDLDSYSSDCTNGGKKKNNAKHKINDVIIDEKSVNKNKKNKDSKESLNKLKDEKIEETTEESNVPKSIIDVLHSRVFKNKKINAKHSKPISIEPKIIPRSKNDQELLAPPTIKKENEHHSVFHTEVLKSRTRTESRILKNQELIREVFGGEDRPASAPPEIQNISVNLENVCFEEKYENYVEKMNVDFGERIRKIKDPNNIRNISEKNNIVATIKKEIYDEEYEEKNKPIQSNPHYSIIIKEEITDSMKDTPSICSGREDVVIPPYFKRKKINKYNRRKGSSGFDYIRKKKKPPSSTGGPHNTENSKRRRIFEVELHHARAENDVNKEIQKWVLNKSVGQSALHKAARLGYFDVIVYCLERMGMNPNPKDNAGYTPLHEACSKGRIDIARVLLQYGANHSETAHSGIRPLHEASENGYIEIVRLLLSYGADPLVTTYAGQTPLMLAENNEMEQFLKSHISDVQNTGPHKQPWKFPGPWKIFDEYECGFDVVCGPPENDSFDTEMDVHMKKKNDLNLSSTLVLSKSLLNERTTKSQKFLKYKDKTEQIVEDIDVFELEEADMPLPPLYLLKDEGAEKWVLLSDLCSILKVKSKDTLLKQLFSTTSQITNKDFLRELKMSDFLEKATCLQLLCAGEKINIHSSKVILIKYNERVQTLLGVKSILMKF